MALAGEHIARLDLVGLQRPVGVHRDAALDHARPTGAAYAATAGERQLGAQLQRRFEDRDLTSAQAQVGAPPVEQNGRSEEHTSELQSLMRISYAVFCLKTKKN